MLFLSVLTDGILEVEVVSCDLSRGNRTSLYMLCRFASKKWFRVLDCDMNHNKLCALH